MIRTCVIIEGVCGWGEGCCWMFESTAKLSSEADASCYNAEAFEMHMQTFLYSARKGANEQHDGGILYVDDSGVGGGIRHKMLLELI